MRCSNNNEKCHKTGDHLGQNTKLINSDEKKRIATIRNFFNLIIQSMYALNKQIISSNNFWAEHNIKLNTNTRNNKIPPARKALHNGKHKTSKFNHVCTK